MVKKMPTLFTYTSTLLGLIFSITGIRAVPPQFVDFPDVFIIPHTCPINTEIGVIKFMDYDKDNVTIENKGTTIDLECCEKINDVYHAKVILTKDVSKEINKTYGLTMYLQDSTDKKTQKQTKLTIEEGMLPEFTKRYYQSVLPMNAQIGENVTKVEATTRYTPIEYTLEDSNGVFVINEDGVVAVAGSIQQEQGHVYKMKVIVTDKWGAKSQAGLLVSVGIAVTTTSTTTTTTTSTTTGSDETRDNAANPINLSIWTLSIIYSIGSLLSHYVSV